VWDDLELDTARATNGGTVVVVVVDANTMNVQGSADIVLAAWRWPELAGEQWSMAGCDNPIRDISVLSPKPLHLVIKR
jgi:hypothetical protein